MGQEIDFVYYFYVVQLATSCPMGILCFCLISCRKRIVKESILVMHEWPYMSCIVSNQYKIFNLVGRRGVMCNPGNMFIRCI